MQVIQLTMFEHHIGTIELSRAMRVSSSTVRKWRMKGMPHTIFGRQNLYLLSEVLEWYDTAVLTGEARPRRVRRTLGLEVKQ